MGWDEPLEKGKVTHSSILAWRISWTIYSMGLERVGQDGAIFTFSLFSKGPGIPGSYATYCLVEINETVKTKGPDENL